MTDIKPMALSETELRALVQSIFVEAKNCGATDAEVGLAFNNGFSVSGRQQAVEIVEYHQDKAVEINVYFGKRSGNASLTDLRPSAIRASVEAACHIAKYTGEDEASGLADQDELAKSYPHIACQFPWDISVPAAIEKILIAENIAMQYDKRIMSAEDVALTTVQALHVYANSRGFFGTFPYSRHQMNCVMVAKHKEEMQREYSYTVSTDPHLLTTPEQLGIEAAERAIKRLGARTLQTMKVPVIYLSEEARGLIGHFAGAIGGGSIYRKSSFLVDKIGAQIFPDFINIQEQPHLAKALGSAPFDDDGIATRDNQFVKNGVLQHYALSVYSAKKLGLKSTGNAGGFHNLTVQAGACSLAELLKKMHKGLLITEMMGNGVSILTGDYSRGAAGFWVDNGEIQYPVHEITVASTLPEIYRNIVDIGNDVDVRGNVRTGSILVSEMMVAGA